MTETANLDAIAEEFAIRNGRATQTTNLLIIDYDVTRYHSFDMIRYLLMDRENFVSLDPTYSEIVKPNRNLAEQVDYVRHEVPHFNPYDLLMRNHGITKINEYEDKLNEAFKNSGMLVTPTELSSNIGILFNRKDINGFIVRYKNDPHKPNYIDQMTVFEDDHILNVDYIIAIIQQYQINSIMVSSIEIAMVIGWTLKAMGINQAITFIIGRYRYNYEEVGTFSSGPKYIQDMNELEYTMKHEFAFFDPYSARTYQNRINKEYET